MDYTELELIQIKRKAKRFKKWNFFRLPCILRGNKVASRNPDSKIRNFSTITKCFSLDSGKWVYLVYAYPLSVIHRLLDGLAKWATEKYCIKIVSRKKWKQAFVKDSFIPIIPIDISNLVAMPYIPNENLYDILADRIGSYCSREKISMIKKTIDIIKGMHLEGIVWGELITPNMIRREDGTIIICDTETVYYRGSLVEQKASDWLDFICSACGAMKKCYPYLDVDWLISSILGRIDDKAVKDCLKERCEKKMSVLHYLFFAHTQIRLSCSLKLYKYIKRVIAQSIDAE